MQGDQFWPATRQLPEQKFKGKPKKQPLSDNMRKKLKRSQNFVKGYKNNDKENLTVFEHKTYLIMGVLLICNFVFRFIKKGMTVCKFSRKSWF